MSEEKKVEDGPRMLPGNLGPFVLRPLAEGMATGLRCALEVGVPPHDVIGMLLNHLASGLAAIEPPGARAEHLKGVIQQLPGMVQAHVDARHMTAGGLYVPDANLAQATRNGAAPVA